MTAIQTGNNQSINRLDQMPLEVFSSIVSHAQRNGNWKTLQALNGVSRGVQEMTSEFTRREFCRLVDKMIRSLSDPNHDSERDQLRALGAIILSVSDSSSMYPMVIAANDVAAAILSAPTITTMLEQFLPETPHLSLCEDLFELSIFYDRLRYNHPMDQLPIEVQLTATSYPDKLIASGNYSKAKWVLQRLTEEYNTPISAAVAKNLRERIERCFRSQRMLNNPRLREGALWLVNYIKAGSNPHAWQIIESLAKDLASQDVESIKLFVGDLVVHIRMIEAFEFIRILVNRYPQFSFEGEQWEGLFLAISWRLSAARRFNDSILLGVLLPDRNSKELIFKYVAKDGGLEAIRQGVEEVDDLPSQISLLKTLAAYSTSYSEKAYVYGRIAVLTTRYYLDFINRG